MSALLTRINHRTRLSHILVEGVTPEVSVTVAPDNIATVRVRLASSNDTYSLVLSVAEAAALGAQLTASVQPYNPPEVTPRVHTHALDVIATLLEVYKLRGIVAADLYVANVLQCDRIDAIRLVREVLANEGITHHD